MAAYTKEMVADNPIWLNLKETPKYFLRPIQLFKTYERSHVRPDVIAGCSIGAFVGAAYLNGRLDANVSYDFEINKVRMRATLFGQNLTDERYQEASTLNPAPGRLWYFEAGMLL